MVDVASLLHLAARNLEYVHLGTRTHSASGFLYGHPDVLSLWVALELVFFHGILVLPVEASGLGPADAVVADGELALLDLSVGLALRSREIVNLLELGDAVEVEGYIEWQHTFLLVVVGMPEVLLVEVEHLRNLQAFPVLRRVGGCDVADGFIERVLDGMRLNGGPFRNAVLVHGSHLHLVIGFRLQVLDGELGAADGGMNHAIHLYLIVVGIGLLIPGSHQLECLVRALAVLHRYLRGSEGTGGVEQHIGVIHLIAIHAELYVVGSDVGLRQSHINHRILADIHLLELAARCGEAVELRSLVEEPCISGFAEFIKRIHLGQLHALSANLRRQLLRHLAQIDAQLGSLVLLLPLEVARGLVDMYVETALLQGRGDVGGGVFAQTVKLGLAVIIIEGVMGFSVWIEFEDALGVVYLRYIVVRIYHRDDGTSLHENRQFPVGSLKLVDDSSTFIYMSAEVIHPFALRQVDAVADIVALLIHLGFLVDRSHEERRTAHELILCCLAQGIRVGFVEEHRSYQRLAGYCLVGCCVDVWHQL